MSKAAAKKDKKSYKAEKIQAKADKRNANYNKYADKLMANRNKRYNKVSQQFDNKISKAGSKGLKNTLSANKTAWQKDFQYGNRMIEYGIKHYNAVNNEYAKTRIDAIYDPSIKKTQRYKLAGKKYINQKWSENGYGKAYATIVAASTYKGN